MMKTVRTIALLFIIASTAAYGGWQIWGMVGTTLNDVDMLNANYGWAVGAGGVIYRYNGSSWVSVTSPTGRDLNAVKVLSTTSAWAVGHGGTTIRWNGSSWQNVNTGIDSHLYAVDFVTATDGWTGGRNGALLRYAGGNWSSATSPTSRHIRGLDMLAANSGWLVGNAGTIYRYNGSSWVAQTSPTARDFNDVEMYNASLGFAVGTYETICRYNGSSWAIVRQGAVITPLNAVAIIGPDDVWTVGAQGLALHYDGNNWLPGSTPITLELMGVDFPDSFNGWAVGEGGCILRYQSETNVTPASVGRVKALFR